MTRKQKILQMIGKMPDDVSYDAVVYKLAILQDIEIGLEQAARGEGIDHDELFDRLESQYSQDKGHLDASRGKSPRRGSRVRRKGSPTDGGNVRKATPKARRKA